MPIHDMCKILNAIMKTAAATAARRANVGLQDLLRDDYNTFTQSHSFVQYFL
jgi:hypothetical protein